MSEGANSSGSKFLLILVVLAAIHLAGIFSIVISPSTFFGRELITDSDYPYHLYHSVAWSRMAITSHGFWGYDPFWMSGSPIGLSVQILDNKPTSLFLLAFSWLDPDRAFKIYVLLTFILVPVVVLWGGRLLRLSWLALIIAGVLALDYWYWDPEARNPVQYASFNFVLASALTPLVAAVFISWSERGGRGWLAWVFLPVVFFIHVTGIVMYLPLFALTFAFSVKKSVRGYAGRVLLLGLLVLVVNAVWWFPFIRHTMRLMDMVIYPFGQSGGWAGLLGIHKDVYSWLRPLLLVVGGWGLLRWWRRGYQAHAVTFGGTALLLFILSNFGTSLGVSVLQPGRFWCGLGFLMTLPAGYALSDVTKRFRHGSSLRSRLLIIALIAGICSPMFYSAFFLPLAHIKGSKGRRISAELIPFMHIVRETQTVGANIVIEFSNLKLERAEEAPRLAAHLDNMIKRIDIMLGPVAAIQLETEEVIALRDSYLRTWKIFREAPDLVARVLKTRDMNLGMTMNEQLRSRMLAYGQSINTFDASYQELISKSLLRPEHWLNASLPLHSSELTEWVRSTIPPNSRILIETYYNRSGGVSSYQAMLPLVWKREMIGGPWLFPLGMTHYERVSFYQHILMGRSIAEFSPDKLKSFFDLYDIRYVIVFSVESREVFSMQDWLTQIDCPDPFYTAFVDRRPSQRFVKGDGHIKADFGRIDIQDSTPDGVIIRYHWIPGLKTVPDLPIRLFPVSGDPIGFIEIQNGNIRDFHIQ